MRVAVLLLIAALTAGAQYPDSAKYTRMDTMIVMRDGVRLHTTVYTPRGAAGPLPILFLRSPYGIQRYRPWVLDWAAKNDYIFAFEDLRGRFRSEGEFVMDRPPLVASSNA